MMKRRLFTVLIAGVMLLTGCGPSDAKAETDAPNDGTQKHTIAVILKTLNSEYWNCVAAGIRQAEADLGCEVILQGPPGETSYDEQNNMIETVLLSSDAEALVLSPLQPDAAAHMVESANIPILSVDTTFESDKLVSYIGVSNENAAAAGGRYIAEKLGGKGNIVILAGVQGDTTSEDRIQGWTRGAEEGGCTVLDVQYTDAVADKAVTTMEGLLQVYSDQIGAVVCHSDDVAMGAAAALEQSGLSDRILICGFGGISGAQPVKDGKLTASVDIGPYIMGYECVAHALEVIEGKAVDSFYPTEASVIDGENVDEYLEKLASWTA